MKLVTKSVLLVSVGGALEWYDFIVYGFFAQILGEQFFPHHDAYLQSILVLVVFAVGYLARPIGSLIFGHVGDKYGRSRALFYTMVFNGIATIWLAVTPNYTSLGILSSILFISARMLQGLTIGGNITGTLVYASEMSNKTNRSFWISVIFMCINRGLLLASSINAIMLIYLSEQQLHSWGWRVAFLTGLSLMGLAGYINRSVMETPYHKDLFRRQKINVLPMRTIFKTYKLAILQCMGLLVSMSILVTQLLLYLPTFLQYHGIKQPEIVKLNFMNVVIFTFVLPFFGLLGDRFSLRKLLIISNIVLIALAYPCYNAIIGPVLWLRYFSLALLSINFSAIITFAPALIVGLFPTSVRYTGVSFSYNLCFSIITGIMPFIVLTLGHHHVMSIKSAVIVITIIGAIITILSCIWRKPKDDHLIVKEAMLKLI